VTTAAPSLEELRRVYRAVRTGGLENGSVPNLDAPARWMPRNGERAILVVGCGGSAGASSVALGLATVAGEARVVECCGPTASGLSFAATAELGVAPGGWTRGSRGRTLIERATGAIPEANAVPIPSASDVATTVVDASWDIDVLLSSPGWLGDLARTAPVIVLVARATVPSLRRLDTAIGLAGRPRIVAAVIGPKRWPRPVEQAVGTALRQLRALARVVSIPDLPGLAMTGITPDPLPSALTRAAEALLALVEGTQP
jgi:hypothetical protein